MEPKLTDEQIEELIRAFQNADLDPGDLNADLTYLQGVTDTLDVLVGPFWRSVFEDRLNGIDEENST